MTNVFTSEDLKVLYNMSAETSVVKIVLRNNNYSPDKFKDLLKSFPREYNFVFNEPYEDLPLKIDDPTFNGYLRWRLSVRK